MHTKLRIFILGIVTLLLVGCEIMNEMGSQLGVLFQLSSKYGGQWQSSISGDGLEIEITNSPHINLESDSISYFATDIGRMLIDSLDYKKSNLTLKIKNESKSGIVTNSQSRTYSYDMDLIRNFKNKTIEDFLIIRMAHYALYNFKAGNREEGDKWLIDIPEDKIETPYVMLAVFEKSRLIDLDKFTYRRLGLLMSAFEMDEELAMYLGEYLWYQDLPEFKEQALSTFKQGLEANENNLDLLFNIQIIHQHYAEFDSTYAYCNKLSKLDTANPRIAYQKAYTSFRTGRIEEGCLDLEKVERLVPEIVIADSMKRYCR